VDNNFSRDFYGMSTERLSAIQGNFASIQTELNAPTNYETWAVDCYGKYAELWKFVNLIFSRNINLRRTTTSGTACHLRQRRTKTVFSLWKREMSRSDRGIFLLLIHQPDALTSGGTSFPTPNNYPLNPNHPPPALRATSSSGGQNTEIHQPDALASGGTSFPTPNNYPLNPNHPPPSLKRHLRQRRTKYRDFQLRFLHSQERQIIGHIFLLDASTSLSMTIQNSQFLILNLRSRLIYFN
jgi:hypothetical protein